MIGKCSELEIVRRSEWGAEKPTQEETIRLPVSKLVIHHTESLTCDSKDTCAKKMRNIQHYHMYERKAKSKFITNITSKLGIILIIPLKRFVKHKKKP